MVLLAAISLPLLVGCGPRVNWELNYEWGMKKAAREQRRALIQFWSPMNEDCWAMDKEVFKDPDVCEVMKRFVPIRLDPAWHGPLADILGARAVPSFVILRPDRETVAVHEGRMATKAFYLFLINNSYK
jgi:uncharacterized protein YyaL (SSP411 family)